MQASTAWLQVLMLVGGMGLTHSGWAAAEGPDPAAQADAPQTSADYLKPSPGSTHTPSASVTLSLPSPSAAQPEFTGQRPTRSASTPSPASPPMYSPVPPPPPAAITITIPTPTAAPTMAESLLRPAAAPTPVAVTPTEAAPAEAAPAEAAPAEASAAEAPPSPPSSPVVPAAIAADESVPAGFNSVFIDPTDYSVGATQAPAANPTVVFSDRATGCQITVPAGQTTPNNTCTPSGAPGATAAQRANPSGGGGQGEINIGPIAVSTNGVRLGSTTIISRAALNERLRPLNVLRRGNESYVFPLSIPAPISSLFGWRMHPVHQSWRFHAGTDLAAPLGTPVLATRAGRVSVSDFLGGYGLTVILRHDDGALESRYAHLSQLAVQAGEWVEQGEVIGLVGTTGTSTGPHLHFELRQMTAQGWLAVDPIEALEYGMANLRQLIDNPLMALGRSTPEAAAETSEGEPLPTDLPFRPAQPNAS